MSGKQQTLGALPKLVFIEAIKGTLIFQIQQNSSYAKVNCDNCEKGFKNNQGYGLHKLTCRKKHCE